jgi:hypothetical protein
LGCFAEYLVYGFPLFERCILPSNLRDNKDLDFQYCKYMCTKVES